MLAEMGHESPLEHISFTFAVEGISRACSHQLVRHRLASYSQQSQSYVKLDKTFTYHVPDEYSSYIKKGVRVEVPFQNRTLEGFVLSITNEFNNE